MENVNSVQTPPRKLLQSIPTSGNRIAEKVIQTNRIRLRSSIACEQRRRIILQSQISALHIRLNEQDHSFSRLEEDAIDILEQQIKLKRANLAVREAELAAFEDQFRRENLSKSTTKSIMERQIAECIRRIDELKRDILEENIEKDQDIIDLRARNLTLIRIKNGELDALQRRRQECSSQLDQLLNYSEGVKKFKLKTMAAETACCSPMKRQIEGFRRRQAQLNLMIDQLQNGIPGEDLAEASNSKMRMRLRSKLSH
jgi:hypothetical protein